ncbi:MAG: bromoperoxidase, partial [Planctomycetota bacterium]
QPSSDGLSLNKLELDKPLTVEGELNKLAANIAIGRNWAGVHYYSDYIESIRLGEEIAIGVLEEQKLTYPENFTMTVPLFDGGAIRI